MNNISINNLFNVFKMPLGHDKKDINLSVIKGCQFELILLKLFKNSCNNPLKTL